MRARPLHPALHLCFSPFGVGRDDTRQKATGHPSCTEDSSQEARGGGAEPPGLERNQWAPGWGLWSPEGAAGFGPLAPPTTACNRRHLDVPGTRVPRGVPWRHRRCRAGRTLTRCRFTETESVHRNGTMAARPAARRARLVSARRMLTASPSNGRWRSRVARPAGLTRKDAGLLKARRTSIRKPTGYQRQRRPVTRKMKKPLMLQSILKGRRSN
ncbi:uncharacterized protein LOC120600342 [Pteropus medius]|uniref:uncharacterized protein LOC120600342 n=1 Tax=Pteropus vampyrus TaxID=132908 RepID=UPI00196B6D03|nr:uncharacterized protein LOC120600342 [Pteropus giganteus]